MPKLPASLTDDEMKTLRSVTGILEAFRSIDSSMPASYAHCLLVVAMKPGVNGSEMSTALGMQRPTVSRVLLELGRRSRPGGPGYGLIEADRANEDLRKVNHQLTPEGQKLIKRIVRAASMPIK